LNLKAYITVLVVILLFEIKGIAQTESGYLPYSTSLLLNPAFAGHQKKSGFASTYFLEAETNNILNHELYLTYDKWSERLNGGTALYFYHGLEGKLNTNHTGIGYTYAPQFGFKAGALTVALNLNYSFYTKQWLVFLVDEIVDKRNAPYEPPGIHFMRYNMFIPRVGFLWSTTKLVTGISTTYRNRHHLGQMKNLYDPEPFQLIFHISPMLSGNQNGLLSKPYRSIPELITMVSRQKFFTRLGIRLERINNILALYLQNDFKNELPGVAGLYGVKFKSLNFNFTVGTTYAIKEKSLSPFGEINLSLIIPHKVLKKANPWAPTKKIF